LVLCESCRICSEAPTSQYFHPRCFFVSMMPRARSWNFSEFIADACLHLRKCGAECERIVATECLPDTNLAEAGTEVPGFSTLSSAVQAEIEGYIAEGTAAIAAKAAGKAPAKAAAGAKRKPKRGKHEDDDDDENDGDSEAEEAPTKAPAAKKARATKAEAVPAAPAASSSTPTWNASGAVVLFTGFRDAALEEGVKSNGGAIASSFNKSVTLLVVADAGTDNAKTKEAAAKGVRVMTADELSAALGVERAGKAKAKTAAATTTAAKPAPKRASKAKAAEDIDDEDEDGEEEEVKPAKKPAAKPATKGSTPAAGSASSGAGQVVLFTGFRDAALEQAVKAAGGSVAGSFTKAVNLLIIADDSVSNAKTIEAASRGVRVMTADGFAATLGVARAGKAKPAAKAAAKSKGRSAREDDEDDNEEDDEEDDDEDEEKSKPASAAPKAAGSGGWNGKGQVVLFTGFRDANMEKAIKAAGGAVASSFTKAVTLVVSKDPSEETGKVKQAREKGISVLGMEEFQNLLSGSGAPAIDRFAALGEPVPLHCKRDQTVLEPYADVMNVFKEEQKAGETYEACFDFAQIATDAVGFQCGRIARPAVADASDHYHDSKAEVELCKAVAKEMEALVADMDVGMGDESDHYWKAFSAPICHGEEVPTKITRAVLARVLGGTLYEHLPFQAEDLSEAATEAEKDCEGGDEEDQTNGAVVFRRLQQYCDKNGLTKATVLSPEADYWENKCATYPYFVLSMTPSGSLVGVVGLAVHT
jgi:hypothetical protein